MITTFLYNMGRVGSNSINRALYDNGVNTLHAHWLSGEFPEAEFATTKEKIVRLLQKDEAPPLKIIVPIREPMARNLSAFVFNSIKYGISGRQETPEELQSLFIERYNIHFPDLWFERELMKNLSFDPFKKKFNYRKGYKFYRAGKHKLVILRLENAERAFPKIAKKFLGIRGASLPHKSNLETKKYIGAKYKKLKELTYPKDFVERVYNLKYVSHFYTEEEIEELTKKWTT
jgi:hypothetical protein